MAAISAPYSSWPSDEELLSCSAAGQREALEELFQRYREPAYRVAFRLLGNEADALDAVQEAFIKVFTHLNGVRKQGSFKTWLLRVVSNSALDLGRQRGRREDRQARASRQGAGKGLGRVLAEDPDQELNRIELRLLLDEALATLSEAQRQTFVLHADGELSYREVADVLGISIGTVMSRLYYARVKLRAFLAGRTNS